MDMMINFIGSFTTIVFGRVIFKVVNNGKLLNAVSMLSFNYE